MSTTKTRNGSRCCDTTAGGRVVLTIAELLEHDRIRQLLSITHVEENLVQEAAKRRAAEACVTTAAVTTSTTLKGGASSQQQQQQESYVDDYWNMPATVGNKKEHAATTQPIGTTVVPTKTTHTSKTREGMATTGVVVDDQARTYCIIQEILLAERARVILSSNHMEQTAKTATALADNNNNKKSATVFSSSSLPLIPDHDAYWAM
jgi:hypothetical protein